MIKLDKDIFNISSGYVGGKDTGLARIMIYYGDAINPEDVRDEILKNQEYVERVGETHLNEIAKNKVIKHRIEKLIKLLDEDHTSEMAECNDYIIDLLKGVLR